MATIRDVAKLAGVSVATVSRVLNKKGHVQEETVRQVEAAIQELEYKPNAVAKSLFKKSSTMIALLVSDSPTSSFFALFSAIESATYEAGYQLIMGKLSGKEAYIDTMLQHQVAGFIVMNEVYEQVRGKLGSIPVVVLDGQGEQEQPSVRCSDYEAARLATEKLIEKGCSFLAHLRGPEQIEAMNERLDGFLDTAEIHGLPYRIVETEGTLEAAEKEVSDLLRQAPYIDGIVACHDLAAIGALRAAHQHGINVPDQLQIIGMDGLAEGACVYPALTTIAQPHEEKGRLAIELLLRQIKGDGAAGRRLQPIFIERETTK